MFEGSRPPIRFCPRIYYLHPRLAGPLAQWPRQFTRIADLGFDHVMLPLPARSGRSLWLIDDYDQSDPALASTDDLKATLTQITRMARDAGLAVLLDLVLDRVASEGRYARDRADLMKDDGSRDPPDPRRDAAWLGATALGLDDTWVLSRVLSECSTRLQAWQDAGIDGFMLQSPQRLPRELTTLLISSCKARRECHFIASAVGLPWDEHARLRDQGYEAVLGSSAHWDFRADWMLEEHRSLSSIAPVITAPELPFGPRASTQLREPQQAVRAASRLLRLAVGSGCGWLMPMGFEYGAREALPAQGGSPEQFQRWQQQAAMEGATDLSCEIQQLNAWLKTQELLQQPARLAALDGAGQGVSAVLRTGTDARDADSGLLLAANLDLAAATDVQALPMLSANAGGLSALQTVEAADEAHPLPADQAIALQAGELRYLRLARSQPVLTPSISRTRRTLDAAIKQARVSIEAISPAVDGGLHPVKRVIGDIVQVEVDAYMDGHDSVAVALLWRPTDDSHWHEQRMRALGNDRWAGEFPLERIGRYQYTICAWRDDWASYRHEIEKKHAARLKISLELAEGLQKIESASAAASDTALRQQLSAIAASLASAADEQRYAQLMSEELATLMQAADTRPFAATQEPALILESEPTTAAFASWYELFPRSMGPDPQQHGTLRDVIAQLPRIRDMGFDVLYFPPIHPIGRKHRKGRNNALTAAPDDPGSPYAIGAAEGGFEAIDPRLGGLDDFRALRDAAREQGLQLALDFAVQCSPDHPWLKDHSDWFAWRPDGTIKYAENPPKKYEDIVNVDFYAEGSMPGLWLALRDAVLFWCNEGVRNFRVDNPHTKPLPFWKWLIADVRGRHPDAVFLAEAFTRPKLMRRLAKIGFSQSYTYFTWRNSKAELTEYLSELTQTEMRDYFRPHFFVNTPDINPLFLQTSGRAGFVIRAVLAATLSGLWGLYSGFELCEAGALPNKEEYQDSEKYQLRAWDWQRPGNISAEISLLNRLRRQHPALQTHLGLSFIKAWNEQVLVYCKATADRSDVLLIAVSLDPHQVQETDFEIPLWDFGLPDHGRLAVEDRVSGEHFHWQGKVQHLRLSPQQPFSIWRLSAPA